MADDTKKDAKEFSLKQVEVQVISGIQQAGFAALAAYVSGLLVDRLAYPVSQNTQFELEGGTNKIKVWEATPEAAPAAEAPAPPNSVAEAIGGDK